MLAHHTQIQMAVVFPIANHIITAVIVRNVLNMDVVVGIQAEAGIVKAFHRIHRVLIVTVGQNAGGGNFRKLVERLLDLVQILEVIQMVFFDIQNHSQRGEEIQERVAILAAFQHDGITVTHTVTCVKQGEITTDHNSGIRLSCHQDVGHHRSGTGLAVGTGNTNCVLIGLHNLAPGLGPFKNGDA